MLKHRKQRDALIVCLEGELDHHCAQAVRQEMDRLIEKEQPQRLLVDMHGVSFMDSSGIGVLIGRYRTLNRRGGPTAVCHMRTPVERTFTLSGLQRLAAQVR